MIAIVYRAACVLFVMAATLIPGLAQSSFITEDAAEFVGSGDFNGDGRPDVLVLDRVTGNVRVGFQNADGQLTWSQPIATGVPGTSAAAVGNFLGASRASLAVTSLEQNAVRVIDLVSSNVATAFPAAPARLLSPYRGAAPPAHVPDWVVSGSDHDPGITLLEVFNYVEDLLDWRSSTSAPHELIHGNALRLTANGETLVAAMTRGSNTTFVAGSLSNGFNAILVQSNLSAGARYAFGRFNNEALPRLLFYTPGSSNIAVQRILAAGSGFAFGTATLTTFTSAVQRVYVLEEQTNSLVAIRFGDGIVGARLPGGSDALVAAYRFGAGSNGYPAAALSLGNGRIALLNAASNRLGTISSDVFQFDGANYVRTSSSALPQPSTYGSRANVWLFATEPFVTSPAVFVSSLRAGDWVSSVSGLPGALSVVAEQDRGASAGLGNASPQPLPAPPNTAVHALGNQYHPAISLFSSSTPRAPQPSLVTISPPGGHYLDAINISFSTSNNSDTVFYRVGGAGSFQAYAGPFPLATNTQVQFYGQAAQGSDRSVLQVAGYTFEDNSFVPLVTTNGLGTNNVPEPPSDPGLTNGIPTYAYGTVFYSRRTGTNGAIWSITLDGIGDRFVTPGTHPRLSPDGRYLAFLRGGRPFDTIPLDNGSIWVRDLLTGDERVLVARTNLIVGFDWEYGTTNLVFDHGCRMFRTDLHGNATMLPFASLCPEDAPAVSPLDGRLAFHSVAPLATNYGLYVTDVALLTKQYLTLPLNKPRRPAWSPDGDQLAFADYAFTYLPESGMNLYVVNPDGTELHQITGFTAIEGFREGALWTPQSDALVGAATIDGINGIWVVPLTPDRHACGAPPFRLPTLSGDEIDFVGSVFVPPGPPRLMITRDGDDVILRWQRTAWPYVLQAADQPIAGADWINVPAPYPNVDRHYEFRIPSAALSSREFFRLCLP